MQKLLKKVPPAVITAGIVVLVLVAVFRFNVLGIQKLVLPSKAAS